MSYSVVTRRHSMMGDNQHNDHSQHNETRQDDIIMMCFTQTKLLQISLQSSVLVLTNMVLFIQLLACQCDDIK
jgi:hypothetical protein